MPASPSGRDRRLSQLGPIYPVVEGCANLVFKIPSRRARVAFARHVLRWPMGDDVWLGRRLRVQNLRGISLGSRVVLNPDVRLDLRGGLEIGDDVAVATGSVILTAEHDPDSPHRAYRTRPVRIGHRVWLATATLVLPGASIADGCVVGAGSVIGGSTEPFTVYGGNPAAAIRARSTDAQARLNASLPRWS